MALWRVRFLRWWQQQPLWVLVPAFSLVGCALTTTGPIVDPDSYWHVLMGRDLVTEHRLTGAPGWTFGPHETWRTTQWLSEVIMAAAHHVAGWSGLTILRLLSAALTAAVLAVATLRGPGSRARLVVFGVSILVLAWEVQERPASFVLPLAAIAGWSARSWLVTQRLPHPAWVLTLTAVWANLHGTWILVPILWAALAGIEVAASHTFNRALAGRALMGAAAGLLTPVGWEGVTSALRIRDAAAPTISEWQPSSIQSFSFVLLLVLTAMVGLAAATSVNRPPVALVLWVLIWAGFAVLAFRNIAVAVVILTPVLADLLAHCWPETPRPAGRGVRVLAAVLVLAVAPATAVASVSSRGGVPPEAPVALIHQIGNEPGARRVLTEYALFGTVQALARPGVSTPLDGRTDRYGKERIQGYLDLLAARPGWEANLRDLEPTDALLADDTALVDALTRTGWSRAGTTDGFVWLRNPTDATDLGSAVMPPPD